MSLSCGSPLRPSLFVYDLPDSYRRRGRLAMSARSGEALNFSFGGYSAPRQPLRHDAASGADVATVFYLRSLAYRCRVREPSAANLFLVPAYNSEISQQPSSHCSEQPRGPTNHHDALYRRLRSQAGDALTARGGADHIFVTPRVGAYFFESHPLCELDLLDPRLGEASRLSVEQTPADIERSPSGPFSYFAAPIFRSIPYPSWVRVNGHTSSLSPASDDAPDARFSAPTAEETAPWRELSHPRPLLAAACFGVSHGALTIVELRRRLRNRCIAAGAGACLYLSGSEKKRERVHAARPSPSPFPTEVANRNPAPQPQTAFSSAAAALYWNATFCLMPGGDSVGRKAILDALLLGCIPVLFHPSQLIQWPWHWGRWVREATVLVDYRRVLTSGVIGRNGSASVPTANEDATYPLDELRAIPTARVRTMQHAIAAHAHRMHWATSDSTDSSDPSSDERKPDERRPRSVHNASMFASLAPPPAPLLVGRSGVHRSGSGKSRHIPIDDRVNDAFAITLIALRARAGDGKLIARGRQLQQTVGKIRAKALDEFVNMTQVITAARDGKCPGSSGRFDERSCSALALGAGRLESDRANASAPKLMPKPPMGLQSVLECIKLCQKCERCQYVSYSLLLQLCAWHHTCNTSQLEQRRDWGSDTYRTFPVMPMSREEEKVESATFWLTQTKS